MQKLKTPFRKNTTPSSGSKKPQRPSCQIARNRTIEGNPEEASKKVGSINREISSLKDSIINLRLDLDKKEAEKEQIAQKSYQKVLEKFLSLKNCVLNKEMGLNY